jgi:ABC-type sugar transport system permease subunit
MITRKSARKIKTRYMLNGLLFLAPATIIFIFFLVYPFFDSLVLSFQKWDGFSSRSFVGIKNYITAFQDNTFLMSIKNSVYLGLFSSIASVIVGVLLAWLLLYVGKREGSLYRTILFSPSMIPPVITGLIFSFVFEPDFGILNNFLGVIGLGFLKTAWLTNQATVLNCLLFVSAWKQVGLTMVLCFAGMQSVPISVLESAKLDGAGDFKVFTKIIVPLINSFIQLSAIFALMSGLKIYDTVVALTNGGPGRYSIVMPMWILENAFTYNKFGYGASMSMIFVLVVLIGMILMKKVVKGESYEQ